MLAAAVGPAASADVLRRALAIGADRAVHVARNNPHSASPPAAPAPSAFESPPAPRPPLALPRPLRATHHSEGRKSSPGRCSFQSRNHTRLIAVQSRKSCVYLFRRWSTSSTSSTSPASSLCALSLSLLPSPSRACMRLCAAWALPRCVSCAVASHQKSKAQGAHRRSSGCVLTHAAAWKSPFDHPPRRPQPAPTPAQTGPGAAAVRQPPPLGQAGRRLRPGGDRANGRRAPRMAPGA